MSVKKKDPMAFINTPEWQQKRAAMPSIRVRPILVQNLLMAEFNPPSRTTNSAISGLLHNVLVNGMLSPVHGVCVVNCKDLTCRHQVNLGDGHRRKLIAERLGFAELWCVLHRDIELADLWSKLSTDTRRCGSLEWLYAWMKLPGRQLESFVPESQAKDIELGLRYLGHEKNNLQVFLDSNTSPHVAHAVNFLYKQFEGLKLKKKDMPTKRAVMLWTIEHRVGSLLDVIRRSPKLERKHIEFLLQKMRTNLPVSLTELIQ